MENQRKEIWDCSVITTEYRCQNRPLGTLGIIGPRRMPYARVIALVDLVARRLTDAIDELI